jgi:hypothetical protein
LLAISCERRASLPRDVNRTRGITRMAEPAGIINRYGPKDDAAFREIVADATPEIQELAHAVRRLVYDVLPQTVEVVWPN